MTPGLRVKFGLLSITALFLAVFAWSAAPGQFRPPQPFNPPRPQPFNPPRPPGMNPPVGFNGGINGRGINGGGFNGGINGRGINGGGFNGGMGGGGIGLNWRCPKCGRTGPGAVPPANCPGCGVHFINGMGNGGGGPPVMNPPPFNPGMNNPPQPNPMPNPNDLTKISSPPSTANGTPSDSSSGSSGKGKMIALIIGIIVVGIGVLAGGTFLMIYTMKSTDSDAPRRKRRRRDDDD